MEQAVAAEKAKSEAHKTHFHLLENDIYQIRVGRAGLITKADNVRRYPWGSSNNSTFACSCRK